jgi:signal transduction histidine kinase
MNKPNPEDIARDFETLAFVPEEELAFLIKESELKTLEEGDYLWKPGEEARHMIMVLSGKLRIFNMQNNQMREFVVVEPGSITSLLPYSRMKNSITFGQALGTCQVLLFPKEKMSELIRENYHLTEALVHLMSTRIREFTTSRLQNEKMLALGKLSAGLAHEMNNPAAAIVRSSKELMSQLKQRPDSFKAVMSLQIDPSEVEAVSDILFERLESVQDDRLSLMQLQSLEDDLIDCLEENEVEDADLIAESLAEFRFSCDDLEQIAEVTKNNFPTVIRWVHENLTTEKMVREIEEASTRISELVKSVKSFTHMDRSPDKIKTNLRSGIDNTLTMLNHKIRKQNIRIERQYAEDLKEAQVRVGEINQVWTNILDNAIDALDGIDDPTISIETRNDQDGVLIYIRDNGPGIPEDIQDRIFDPFFTTKDVGKGTGMGLEMVKNIIDQHGGRVNLKSSPGSTQFEIKLPLK